MNLNVDVKVKLDINKADEVVEVISLLTTNKIFNFQVFEHTKSIKTTSVAGQLIVSDSFITGYSIEFSTDDYEIVNQLKQYIY